MASLRDIRRRIKSVSSTAQITRAMQMVAASKMRKAQQAALVTRPFTQLLYRVQRHATTHAPDFTHPLLTVPGSTVAALVPEGRVGSLHHQAVATHDDRWRRTATAPDGVVEALEWADQRDWPCLGVQWHPELDRTGPAVFGWLARAAVRPAMLQA